MGSSTERYNVYFAQYYDRLRQAHNNGVTLLSPTNRGISSIHEPRNKSDNTDKNGDMHLHTKEVIFNMYVAKPTFC